MTPTANLIEGVDVGDYVTTPDASPFVPLPEELFSALVHRTAGVILRALAYDEEAGQQLQVAEDAINHAKAMLMPRNEGNPQRVTGGLRSSLMGRSWMRGRWY